MWLNGIYRVAEMPVGYGKPIGCLDHKGQIFILNTLPIVIQIFVLLHEVVHVLSGILFHFIFKLRNPMSIGSDITAVLIDWEYVSAVVCRRWMVA